MPTARPPAALDLSALPLEDASAALRRLSLWSLAALFESSPDPVPDLLFWRRGISRRARRRWCDPRRAPKTKHAAWAVARMREALDPNRGPMPDMMLWLAGTIAWSRPDFELAMWRFARRRLERCTIHEPALEARLGFSVPALWLLVAMALHRALEEGRGNPGRWFVRGRNRAAMRRLETTGRERAQARTDWAGFWDQWLVTEALLALPEPLREHWLENLPGLKRLPVFRIRAGLHPVRMPRIRGERELYRGDWSDGAPPELLDRYGYRVRPPPL